MRGRGGRRGAGSGPLPPASLRHVELADCQRTAPPPLDPKGFRAGVGAAEDRAASGTRPRLRRRSPGGGRRGGDQPSRRTRRARPWRASARGFGGRGGGAPRQPCRGHAKRGHGRQALRPNRRPTSPAAACPGAIVDRRQRDGRARPRAIQRTRSPGLAKRGRRWDGGPRYRAVHVPAKPERRPTPAPPPSGDTGVSSAMGWIYLNYASPPVFRLVSVKCPLPRNRHFI